MLTANEPKCCQKLQCQRHSCLFQLFSCCFQFKFVCIDSLLTAKCQEIINDICQIFLYQNKMVQKSIENRGTASKFDRGGKKNWNKSASLRHFVEVIPYSQANLYLSTGFQIDSRPSFEAEFSDDGDLDDQMNTQSMVCTH